MAASQRWNSRTAREGGLGLLAAADAYELSRAERRALASIEKSNGQLSQVLNELARQLRAGVAGQPPLVLTVKASPDFHVGWLLPYSDLDAFLVALLGEPVPTIPRWMSEPLVAGGEIAARTSMDALAQLGMPGHLRRRIAANTSRPEVVRLLLAGDLAWVGDRLELDSIDPLIARLFEATVEDGRFEDHPLLRPIDRAARGSPRYRRPAHLANFRPVHIVPAGGSPDSPFGRCAFVIWYPGVSRAGLAARLRYVFSRVLAPWSTSPSAADRRARYLAYLGRLGAPCASMQKVADHLQLMPEWADLDRSALVRRLEHWSAEAALWARQRPPIG